MNTLTDNPVFQREARWGRRLRRLRRNRPLAVMVALVALAIGWLYWQGLNFYADPQTPYDNGGDLWRLCSNTYLVLIVLLTPALASSAISQEKEQQTWEALATTRLTPAQILMGKWLGRLVLLGWLWLLLLPLLLISAGGADLPPVTILIVFGFFALNVGLYGMIGLLCSFVARKTLAATTVSLVITSLLCIGTWVAHTLLLGLSQTGGDFALMMRYSGLPSPLWVNPFFVLSLLSQPRAFVMLPYPNGQQVHHGSTAYYGDDVSPPSADGVVATYSVASLLVIAFCFYYMFTRYRRTVRGGRPLGEPLK